MDELREPTFLILCALADGPRHGYAIRLDVDATSGGRVAMRTGTLYTALNRLAADGLIERTADDRVSGRVRHYYRLTDPGRTALADAAARRAEQARLASARLKNSARASAVWA